MAGQDLVARLQKKFGVGVVGANTDAVDPWIEVAPESLVAVCEFLKAEPDLQFDMLNCISGVDYCEPDAKKAAKVDWKPHMEVVYHLSSIAKKHTLVVKVMLPPSVPLSVESVSSRAFDISVTDPLKRMLSPVVLITNSSVLTAPPSNLMPLVIELTEPRSMASLVCTRVTNSVSKSVG